MAEQRINLNNFKASGVYTIEIDQSENVVLPLTTGRLIVGSSRVGPYNTVVLINDLRTLKAVFGEIDPKLEKAGSFFHRTIEVALREGPVFALNVVPLDPFLPGDNKNSNLDLAYYSTFNTEAASNNDTDITDKFYPTVEYFNRLRLWFADADRLNRVKNIDLGDDPLDPNFGQNTSESNKILSFANLGSSNCTIWVRKADVRGFDLTAKEWYSTVSGSEVEFPSFVHQDDFISDYFVEVIAVNGDWTNYLKLSKDPVYSQFFDESGLKSARSADFFALREIKTISRTIGCLIPDFKDQRGLTVSIDRLVNRLFPTTGILCALDVKKLDLINLTNGTFTDADVETHRVDIIGHGYDELNSGNTYLADDGGFDALGAAVDPTPMIDVLSYKRPADTVLVFTITNDFGSVSGELDEANFLNGFQDNALTLPVQVDDTYVIKLNPPGEDYVVALENSTMYKAYANGFLKTGDTTTDATPTTHYLKIEDNLSVVPDGETDSVKYIKVTFFSDSSLLNQISIDPITVAINGPAPGADYSVHVTLDGGAEFKKTFNLTTDFLSYTIQQPNKLILEIDPLTKATVDEFIKVNHYIKAQTTSGRHRLLKIISISKPAASLLSPSTEVYTVTTMAPTTDEVIGLDTTGNTIQVYKGIANFVTSLKGQYVRGFKVRDASLPSTNGGAARQDEILQYLFENTSIPQTLANGELVDFRYVVDSYDGQITQSSKYYLTKLAAMHGQAMAIVNSPSIQQFEKSVDPSFIDTTTQAVSAQLISEGGNLNLNPSFTFKFAEEDINGIPLSSYAHFSFPNLIIRSGSKNISVPPAAYVSNLFVRKFKNGTPFLIVAGGRRGVINDPDVVGIEYDLSDEDRAFLEPVGHNLIVRRRGFGILLFSNNTAYQRINSALNNAHVRDNLSTIERDIEKILFNFLFDFNDEITRLRVKTIVQNYLDAVVSARGLSSYEVIFDSSNNTEEVISANTAIIDILVDFPRGIHKFINRITITRVGGSLSSETTGFIPSF
jgi:hypothetical protein